MKLFRNIINGIIWSVLGLYVALVLLTHIPAAQRWIGGMLAEAAAERLGTNVEIERVDIGWFNRLIIDGVRIDDLYGRRLMRASRMSVKVDIAPTISYLTGGDGRLSVSSAQLFGMQCDICTGDSTTPANYQFIIDALASDDTTHTPLNVHFGSLIIRRGRVTLNEGADIGSGDFTRISDISTHIVLPYLTDDSIAVTVKKMSMNISRGRNDDIRETDVRGLSLAFKADRHHAELKDMKLRLPGTELSINADATYAYAGDSLDPQSLRYEAHVEPSVITPADISLLDNRLQTMTMPVSVNLSVVGSLTALSIENLLLRTADGDVDIALRGAISGRSLDSLRWRAEIDRLSLRAGETLTAAWHGAAERLPADGHITLSGEGGGEGSDGSLLLHIQTGVGQADIDAEVKGRSLSACLSTDGIDIGRITGKEALGLVVGSINIDADRKATGAPWIGWQGTENVTARCDIPLIEYNGYRYSNISALLNLAGQGDARRRNVDASLSMRDPNGNIDADAEIITNADGSDARLEITADGVCPQAMRLSDKWGDAVFGAQIKVVAQTASRLADIKSLTDIAGASIEVDSLTMRSTDNEYSLSHLRIEKKGDRGYHLIALDGDFVEAAIFINEEQAFADEKSPPLPLPSLFTRDISLSSVLHSLPLAPRGSFKMSSTLTLKKTDWLRALLGVPLTLGDPLEMNVYVNENTGTISAKTGCRLFNYDGTDYADVQLTVRNAGTDTLTVSAGAGRMDDSGRRMDLNMLARAAVNSVYTEIGWDNNRPTEGKAMQGTVKATTEILKDSRGLMCVNVDMHPSEILVNDTVWRVHPSRISYSDKRLQIDHFAIAHNNQHILVSGMATDSAADSITADLNDVDIDYILNLVNFHAVRFGGHASGRMCAKSIFGGQPDAYARISVPDFLFQDGPMGYLTAFAVWNRDDKQIDIDARADDGPGQLTIIQGYVSPERNYIDLGIMPHGSRLKFMESFCSSFMRDVNANAYGELRVIGDLREINLVGCATVDGDIGISSLNTVYHLKNDTITFIPNEIIFRSDTVSDDYGNKGIISGALHHKHLTRLTYDLDIETSDMLVYDHKDYGDNTFYGTVFVSGTCTIKGRSGRIDFDISGTPSKGSFIEYNAASTGTDAEQGFITWRDKATLKGKTHNNTPDGIDDGIGRKTDIPSDMNLNFLINATPDFTLRVLMDQQSGDYIALNGRGTIKASYYNKGSFDMFGNYAVESGLYRLTIQNIMSRNFSFQNGSTIVFGGNPYDASLNLKATHTVNGVPLSDLHIGNSFSGNNIRADCVMNISGTPLSPHVDFDLDLPTMSSDAEQMVRSLINSEEEMNQQVIYLLTIGRFYVQDYDNSGDTKTSQTSLAMQSILSGTVSQQINNLLSSFVNISNWNVGANISTGDEGWNNAEYEGLLSGSLLNNRLLINGQFGYRDNDNATTSFIGDFDISYLLTPNGNISLKVYNQTNDRYFTKSSLNTQGVGIMMKKDFSSWRDLVKKRKKQEGND